MTLLLSKISSMYSQCVWKVVYFFPAALVGLVRDTFIYKPSHEAGISAFYPEYFLPLAVFIRWCFTFHRTVLLLLLRRFNCRIVIVLSNRVYLEISECKSSLFPMTQTICHIFTLRFCCCLHSRGSCYKKISGKATLGNIFHNHTVLKKSYNH